MRRCLFWMPDTFLWNDLTTAPHIGGREYSVMRVAEELATRGWQVSVACPMPTPTVFHGVRYLQPDPKLVKETEVIVALNGYEILPRASGTLRVIWLCTGMPDLTPWKKYLDLVVVSSPLKRQAVASQNPFLFPDQIQVIYSGTDPDAYALPVPRHENRLIWCSARERGLQHLLRWWPRLREEIPDLTLHVTYDPRLLDTWRWQQELRSDLARQIALGLTQEGITDLGALTREQLVVAQQEATLWACPVEFYGGYETGSFSVLEFAAAQTPMLLGSDPSLTELGEGVAHFLPNPVDDTAWIFAISALLRNRPVRERYARYQTTLAERYTWAKTAGVWDEMLDRLMHPITADSLVPA